MRLVRVGIISNTLRGSSRAWWGNGVRELQRLRWKGLAATQSSVEAGAVAKSTRLRHDAVCPPSVCRGCLGSGPDVRCLDDDLEYGVPFLLRVQCGPDLDVSRRPFDDLELKSRHDLEVALKVRCQHETDDPC